MSLAWIALALVPVDPQSPLWFWLMEQLHAPDRIAVRGESKIKRWRAWCPTCEDWFVFAGPVTMIACTVCGDEPHYGDGVFDATATLEPHIPGVRWLS